MTEKPKGTAWIQNLNKAEIIEELEGRGETFKKTDTYDKLREQLRELIKTENEAYTTPGNSEPETEPDGENNMADQKFEFQQNDDWELFEEKLDCLFIAKNIIDNKVKVATLVTKLGPEPHALLKQLIAPAKIKDGKYEDLTKALSDHLNPKPSEAMERCTFHTTRQESHESITDYIARLKKLAIHCNFTELDNAIRDQLVCGISDKDIRIKLFEEKELTLKKAQEIALAREAAVKNATNSNTTLVNKSVRNEVHVIKGDEQRAWQHRGQRGRGIRGKATSDQHNNNIQQQPSQHSTGPSKAVCNCCGKVNHSSSECRFRYYVCNKCNKKGHLARACKSGKNVAQKSNEIKKLTEDSDDSDEDSDETRDHEKEFFSIVADSRKENSVAGKRKKRKSELRNDCTEEVFNHTSKNRTGLLPMYVELKINGKKLDFEIDTGTFATVISEKTYNKYFCKSKITETKKDLRAYGGHALVPLGELTDLEVTFNNTTKVLKCFVLPGTGPALMGREWLTQFSAWPLTIPKFDSNIVNKIEGTLCDYLARKYPTLFSDSPGLYNKSKTKIHVKENTQPIALKCRHAAYALRLKLEKEIDRLVELGHLKRVDVSEWATPIVPVLKGNNEIRICGDFKLTLNPHLLVNKYPLHTIDEIFAKLQGGKIFSELDLKHAYMQFPVDDESAELLTIITHKGLYKYTKIPEGISPAPADIQRKMDECLDGIDGVIAYLDNIYVSGKTEEEHSENLKKVCKRLQDCNLRLNLKKCKFMQSRIDVLGFVIDKDGLHKSKSKINAMVNAPRPTNEKELASLLGLVNFYARFLKNRSVKLKPLYELLNKEKKEWDKECETAFKWVKNELISPNFLAHYDPNEELILACDASDYGLSAILSHRYKDGSERPIAYASKKIPRTELKRAIIDKEAMAIVFGCKRFYQFVFGKEITLRTDNKPLELILGPRKGIPQTADNRLQRYAYYLSGYRYKIEHVKSERNANADALSRLPVEDDTDSNMYSNTPSQIYFFEDQSTAFNSKMLAAESKKDKVLSDVIRYVTGDWPNYNDLTEEKKIFYKIRFELSVEKECLFWGVRACIPEKMRFAILNELHATHFGVVKMKMFARSYVYWPGIDSAIEEIANTCKTCLIDRKAPNKTPLTTWPFPSKVWGRIHCDYAKFEGDMYLIVIDAHSKWPEIINCKKNTDAKGLIKEFKILFTRFGLPIHCVTDGGPQFRSVEFCNFLKANNIEHTFSPPYHPATNGAAENFIQTFKHKVAKIIKKGENVENAVSKFVFDYRNYPHCTTGRSPANIMYNRNPRTRFDCLKPSVSAYVENQQRRQIVSRPGNRKTNVSIGDNVYMDAHGVRDENRIEGKIMKQTAPSTYVVQADNGKPHKRHIDQLIVPLRRSQRLLNKKGEKL